MMDYSLVIPCFNEQENVPQLFLRLTQLVETFSTVLDKELEVILVENGSTDNTRQLITRFIANQDSRRFKAVYIDSNIGYGNGIYQGLLTSEAKYIGWTHADLQCDPYDFFRLAQFSELNSITDSFYLKGLRLGRRWSDVFFTLSMSVFETLLFLKPLSDINAQPCLFPRELLNSASKPPLDFSFDLYIYHLALELSFSVYRLPVLFVPRLKGVSSWNISSSARYRFIKRTLSYSIKLRQDRFHADY